MRIPDFLDEGILLRLVGGCPWLTRIRMPGDAETLKTFESFWPVSSLGSAS